MENKEFIIELEYYKQKLEDMEIHLKKISEEIDNLKKKHENQKIEE